MPERQTILWIALCVLLISACEDDKSKQFTLIDPDRSAVHFNNILKEDEVANVMNYLYFYNGAGVATGDINNDGLTDLFFTGNMVPNRLYLNKDDFRFEDITKQSGIAEQQGWCTGANMVDINQDGLLDIYICRSADILPQRRQNLLYINEGQGHFSEQAMHYGLADPGYSTQAAFFDYDRDGDLDMFLINHSQQQYAYGAFEKPAWRNQKNPYFASKLYRNDNQHFSDVSESAGIVSNVLSFGLGIAITDYNRDGWPDIYLSNDFNEPDYLYRNNADGTFTESLTSAMDQVSLYSMGSDAADINNDAFPDLVTLDMLPESNYQQKMHSGAENFNKFQQLFKAGFYYQYSRNMLQLNNGDGSFSEIAQSAGIANTDWSWSALLADFDNDGRKDLFVSNGYARDYTNMDFMKYRVDQMSREKAGQSPVKVADLLKEMPTINLSNYLFQQDSTGKFTNQATSWGLAEPGVSSGAVYADLDNDGDLDLVVSNTNAIASIYRNNNETLHPEHKALRLQLKGPPGNRNAIGAAITAYSNGEKFFVEQQPARGYQSSVDQQLQLGIGSRTTIDSLRVRWPDGTTAVYQNIDCSKPVVLSWKTGLPIFIPEPAPATYLKAIAAPAYQHRETAFNDFTLQGLLPQYQSRYGPCMAKADVDGNGLEDLFIGSSGGQASQLLLQQTDGQWTKSAQPDFLQDSLQEAVAAIFFDANRDGYADLYVASGGYALPKGDQRLGDRFYLNDGKGKYRRTNSPELLFPKGALAAADIDLDGDQDIFVGGRMQGGNYPLAAASNLLLNDGNGGFSISESSAKSFLDLGMVTGAAFTDLNGDGYPDLIVLGDWMPVTVLTNGKKGWTDSSSHYISFPSKGNWNGLLMTDLDNDGDQDFIAGNNGTNGQLTASVDHPLRLWYKDFDRNGSLDPIIGYTIQGKEWPLYSRDDLVEQLPMLNKKYLNYSDYASASMEELLVALDSTGVRQLQVDQLETIWLENRGKEGLKRRTLPREVQYAPIYAMAATDVNGDGKTDLILAGNNSWARIKLGRFRANHGLLLLADQQAGFNTVAAGKTGFQLRGDCRSILPVKGKTGFTLFAGMNEQALQAFEIVSPKSKTNQAEARSAENDLHN